MNVTPLKKRTVKKKLMITMKFIEMHGFRGMRITKSENLKAIEVDPTLPMAAQHSSNQQVGAHKRSFDESYTSRKAHGLKKNSWAKVDFWVFVESWPKLLLRL